MNKIPLEPLHVVVEDRRATGQEPLISDDEMAVLAEVLVGVLAAEGTESGAEAGLIVVDAAEMSDLNVEHMGETGPTDVLSFPIDGAGGGVGWIVGDVIVCAEVAAAQAEGHSGSVEDEFRLMVVHGGLHLCGWDHDTDAKQTEMWAREKHLMAELGVSPSGDPWGLDEHG